MEDNRAVKVDLPYAGCRMATFIPLSVFAPRTSYHNIVSSPHIFYIFLSLSDFSKASSRVVCHETLLLLRQLAKCGVDFAINGPPGTGKTVSKAFLATCLFSFVFIARTNFTCAQFASELAQLSSSSSAFMNHTLHPFLVLVLTPKF
jgi:hypothetical protein